MDQRITKVVLHFFSLIDGSVLLDERNWAVTLVSPSIFSSHAMLACEGVENRKPFLRYVHFTQNPRQRHPKVTSHEGQIESFDAIAPLSSRNGPTIRRSRELVKNLLRFAQDRVNQRLPFMSGLSHVWRVIFGPIDNPPMTSLSCAYLLASKAGIIYQSFSGTVLQIPDGFDRNYLGRPFPEEQRELSQKMLTASIILTPIDCPIADIGKWALQIVIEENAVTDRVMERLIDPSF